MKISTEFVSIRPGEIASSFSQILPRRRFLGKGLAALVGLGLGGLPLSKAEVQIRPAPFKGGEETKVLLDTDIGSGIDDATCLAYLLAQRRCRLMGITIATGDSERRAQIASSLCQVAGVEVPIYRGIEAPLLVPQRQPIAEQAELLGNLARKREFAGGQAIDFMRDLIRANPAQIELIAVGPLTNIALLFAIDPEIPGLLRGLTLMCGKFIDYPSPWGLREWNAMLDPHAAAIVYRNRCRRHRSIGLDVTLQLAMKPEAVAQRFKHHPLLRLVHRYSEAWFSRRELLHFHDPLAAVTIFNEDICYFQRGEVRVALDTEMDPGRTHWAPREQDGPHEVALEVDPELFFDEYFSVFS